MNTNVLIKNLFHQALNLNTDMMVIKSEGPEIHLFSTVNSSTPKRIEHDLDIQNIQFHEILDYLRAAAFGYNEIKGALARNLLEDKNILLTHAEKLILGKITKGSSLTPHEASIQLNFCDIEATTIDQIFTVSNKLKMLQQKSNDSKLGVVLFNMHERAASVFLQTLLPDANFIELAQLKTYLQNNNQGTKQSLLIGHQFEDAADGILNYLEMAKNIGAFDWALNSLDHSVTLKSLRKQCGVCAKPTAIPSDAKHKFPLAFRKQVPDSYQFSRGCATCGYSSYRGVTFIESILPITPEAKSALSLSLEPTTIYKEQVRHPGSGIFENAISQIQAGVVSVEEVLKVLPVISNALDAFLSNNPHNERTNVLKNSSGKPSILIVEDDENQREVLKLVFFKEGYEVLTAQNGKEALNIISKAEVQVILSDLMMPEMNGMEFLKCCKADQRLANIPVMMLTASSNPDHELTLLEQGADDYCPKNVKKKVLLKRVEKLLEKRSAPVVHNPLDHLLND